ncbi:MAG: hypothetical protein ACJ8G1_17530 [Vitreoscilla sp.]
MIKRQWYAGAVFAILFVTGFSQGLGRFLQGSGLMGLLESLLTSAFGSAIFAGLFYAIYRWRSAFVVYKPTRRFMWVVGTPLVLFGLIGLTAGDGNKPQAVQLASSRDPLPAPTAEEKAKAASAVAEINRQAAMSPEERQQAQEQWVVGEAKKLVAAQNPASPADQTRDSVWDATRERLKTFNRASANYKDAQSVLASMAAADKKMAEGKRQKEAEDKKQAAALAKTLEPLQIAARKEFATKLEQQFLEQRMDTTVTAIGNKSTTLSIKWVLASRVAANDLSKSGVIDQARELGFKSVHFFNGFESELAEGWTWKL